MPELLANLSVNDRESKTMQIRSQLPTSKSVLSLLAILIIGCSSSAIAERKPQRIPASVYDDVLGRVADGWSTDEVLVRPEVRQRLLLELSKVVDSPIEERDALLTMLRHRKAGRLEYRSQQRHHDQSEASTIAVEIAGRTVMDRHRITSDTLVCDPKLRAEYLNEFAKVETEGVVNEADTLRSLMRLRKQRQLKPELVLQIADWQRSVTTWSVEELDAELQADGFSRLPGVYLFRDASGYLYVGEAKDLAKRLRTHLDSSDRLSLLAHLKDAEPGFISVEVHAFSETSPASKVSVRRAYESELIRSRKPRLNIRP